MGYPCRAIACRNPFNRSCAAGTPVVPTMVATRRQLRPASKAVATGDRCDEYSGEYGGHNDAVGDALDQLIIGTFQRLR
jgi:hypothetical protein